MNKNTPIIMILLFSFLLASCTRITTSNEDHALLSQRLNELDLETKDYYQASINIVNDSFADNYTYMYVFNDITDTYHSTYTKNNTIYEYAFNNGNFTFKITQPGILLNIETHELTFDAFESYYVSSFGSQYLLDLTKASYKREESFFSFSNNSYLKNYFTFPQTYEYSVNLFDLEVRIANLTVEFGSIKNQSNTTLFDQFTIRGKTSENDNVVITITQ